MKSHIALYFVPLALVVTAAWAGTTSESYAFPGIGIPVPDNGVPLSYSINLDGSSAITDLTGVEVSLNLAGSPTGSGWAGDLFVSLNHDFGNQTAVLLNQVGVTGSNPFGFGFDGWNLTFKAGAANGDVHLGQPAGTDTILSGNWEPDGRIDPLGSLRPSQLNVFDSFGGAGDWTLTVVDLAPGGNMTLNSWALTLVGNIGSPVPEPENGLIFAAATLAGFAIWRQKRRP